MNQLFVVAGLEVDVGQSEQALVDDAIKETGAHSIKDMGKVIKIVVSQAEGRADNKLISALAKKSLSNNA